MGENGREKNERRRGEEENERERKGGERKQ